MLRFVQWFFLWNYLKIAFFWNFQRFEMFKFQEKKIKNLLHFSSTITLNIPIIFPMRQPPNQFHGTKRALSVSGKKKITAEHSRPINIGVASNQRDRGSCFPQERTPNRPTQFMRSIAAVDGPRNSRIIYLSLAGSIQCCIWGIVDGGDLYKSETLWSKYFYNGFARFIN